MKVNVPPIKSQGIKTKLVPWIKSIVPADFDGLWIEPFMGTGVVAFNIAPKRALLCDTNPHLINFYSEKNRNPMIEAIVANYDVSMYEFNETEEYGQMTLFEKKAAYSFS
jgi:DNA adenine methylase